MSLWTTESLIGAAPVAEGSQVATVSRNAKAIDVFWISSSGAVCQASWEEGDIWTQKANVAGDGSAAAGGLAAISRRHDKLDIIWVNPRGGIEGRSWTEGGNWQTFSAAGDNSASAGSPLVAVSWNSLDLDIFWIASDGSVHTTSAGPQLQSWRTTVLAPAGKAKMSLQSLAACWRLGAAGMLLVYWINPAGAIFGTSSNRPGTLWVEIQRPHFLLFQPPAVAIAITSRNQMISDLYWVTNEGAVKNAQILVIGGNSKDTLYEIAPPRDNSSVSGLVAISPTNASQEVYWSDGGSLWNVSWQQKGTWTKAVVSSAPGTKNGIGAISRTGKTVSVWFVTADGKLQGKHTSTASDAVFSGNLRVADTPELTGWAEVIIFDDGTRRFRGSVQNADDDEHYFGVFATLSPAAGIKQIPLLFMHRDNVMDGSQDRPEVFDWDDHGWAPELSLMFKGYQRGSVDFVLRHTTNGDTAEHTFLKQIVGTLLSPLSLIIYAGGLLFTAPFGKEKGFGRVVAGAFWMAGPFNSWMAISADKIAVGTMQRQLTQDEYDWAIEAAFGPNSLPPRERIWVSNTIGFGNREFVFPGLENKIIMNLGEMVSEDPSIPVYRKPQLQSTFVHEMTHVWQIYNLHSRDGFISQAAWEQTVNSITDIFGNSDIYNYGEPGKPFKEFTFEQQAQMVEDWYRGFKVDSEGHIIPSSRRPMKDQNSPYFRYIEGNIRMGFY